MHRMINPAKALRTMRKTPALLTALLEGVTQYQAAALRDGRDGWSVLEIVCHLRDIELAFTARARLLLAEEGPTLPSIDIHDLLARGDYSHQDLRAVLAEYRAHREAFIALLEGLGDEQWLRAGTHPEQGPATLLDVAVNAGLHDIDHLEQIVRCLAPLHGALD